jgi:hypothetical protein
MRYSKGIMWLDDCRIPFVDENTSRKQTPVSVEVYGWANHKGLIGSFDDSAKQGRFTPNLLVCDDMLNDGSIGKSNGSNDYNWDLSNNNNPTKITKNIKSGIHFNDKGTNSRYYDLDKWFDKVIDEIQ